jgi:hypothetical protein
MGGAEEGERGMEELGFGKQSRKELAMAKLGFAEETEDEDEDEEDDEVDDRL